MELRVLRYFLAVAREENITAAAQTLHVTQPTLSKQLMDLEGEFGKKLFNRGKRKITLTEDGMLLRKRAQELIDLADRTEAELRASDETVTGEVCIGAGETRGVRLLAGAVGELRGRYPGIRYSLFSGNGEDVAERLDKGLLDFGLFVGNTDFKKYDYLKLPISDAWGLILRKDSPLAAQADIRPADIREIPLLCSRQALIRNELSGWLGYAFEQLHIVATYNLVYNASLFVEAGIGAAICIEGLVNTTGDSPLCFRPFRPRIAAELTLAWKKYQLLTKAQEKFLEAVQRRAGAYAGRDA